MTYLTPEMRWFLLGGSILVFLFMMHFIRKSRVRIEDTMFWIIMCVGLIIISVFPQIPFWFARILKVESPANFVFLIMIAILLVNQFYMTLKISRMQIKITELVQRLAIDTAERNEKKDK
ncbi:MAG: DUF2304 domain-containing protein [Oscillospiraceae bacterium]|nr:DUF2304 domain-containing protein [Oscillospiraceae bacterium]